MKQVTITIETENAAFEGHPGTELERILRGLAGYLEYAAYPPPDMPLFDINGNKVGELKAE